jgi:diguanylate cyclase (GGDEF)-like protein
VADRRKIQFNYPFFKLLAWMTTVSLVIILVYSFWNYFSVANIYTSNRQESSKLLVKGIGLSLGDKLLARDYAEAELILRRSFANQDIDLALVSDLNGKVLFGLKRVTGQDQLELIYNAKSLSIPDAEVNGIKIQSDGDANLQAWYFLNAGLPVGWLYLELKDEAGAGLLSRLRVNLVLVMVFIFLILFLTLLLLDRVFKRQVFQYENTVNEQLTSLNQQASQDSLTNLPNRRSLHNAIQSAFNQANDHDQLLAVLFLDLDGFKGINDRFGHQVGDLLLIQFSKRLTKLFRSEDQIFRYGGDEFVICCENLESRHELESLIERVLEGLSAPYDLNGNWVKALASIGVTIYPVDTVSSALELITHADEALYQAKELGKNQSFFYC